MKYENQKRLDENRHYLYLTKQFISDVEHIDNKTVLSLIKTTNLEIKDITYSDRKKLKELENRQNIKKIVFQNEKEFDSFVLEYFTGYKISDFARNPKLKKYVLSQYEDFTNENRYNYSENFTDLKIKLTYDIIKKYENELTKDDDFDFIPHKIEKKSFGELFTLRDNIYYQNKDTNEHTTHFITKISHKDIDKRISISFDVDIVKHVYENGIYCNTFKTTRHYENIIVVGYDKINEIINMFYRDITTLGRFVDYDFYKDDVITECDKNYSYNVDSVIKEFSYQFSDLFLGYKKVYTKSELFNYLKSLNTDDKIKMEFSIIMNFEPDLEHSNNITIMNDIISEVQELGISE